MHRSTNQGRMFWGYSNDYGNYLNPYGVRAQSDLQEDRLSHMIWERMQTDSRIRTEYAQARADNDDVVGLYEIGMRYLHGWGVSVDVHRAQYSLDKAAKQGHAGACYELAKQYIHGNSMRSIPKDLEKAKEYISYGKNKERREYDTINYKQEDSVRELISLEKVIQAMENMQTNRSRYM